MVKSKKRKAKFLDNTRSWLYLVEMGGVYLNDYLYFVPFENVVFPTFVK